MYAIAQSAVPFADLVNMAEKDSSRAPVFQATFEFDECQWHEAAGNDLTQFKLKAFDRPGRARQQDVHLKLRKKADGCVEGPCFLGILDRIECFQTALLCARRSHL